MTSKYTPDQAWKKPCPFILADWETYDEDGRPVTLKSWRPGVRHEFVEPDDSKEVWDGMGYTMRFILAVVPLVNYGPRILYRQLWYPPNAPYFGKGKVKMTTPAAFGGWVNDSNGHRDERRPAILINAEGAEAA